jgi:hypothetical protein
MRAALPSRDESVVVAGIAGLTALAWLDLWRRTGEMTHDSAMSMAMVMPKTNSWSVPDLLAAGAMWWCGESDRTTCATRTPRY